MPTAEQLEILPPVAEFIGKYPGYERLIIHVLLSYINAPQNAENVMLVGKNENQQRMIRLFFRFAKLFVAHNDFIINIISKIIAYQDKQAAINDISVTISNYHMRLMPLLESENFDSSRYSQLTKEYINELIYYIAILKAVKTKTRVEESNLHKRLSAINCKVAQSSTLEDCQVLSEEVTAHLLLLYKFGEASVDALRDPVVGMFFNSRSRSPEELANSFYEIIIHHEALFNLATAIMGKIGSLKSTLKPAPKKVEHIYQEISNETMWAIDQLDAGVKVAYETAIPHNERKQTSFLGKVAKIGTIVENETPNGCRTSRVIAPYFSLIKHSLLPMDNLTSDEKTNKNAVQPRRLT